MMAERVHLNLQLMDILQSALELVLEEVGRLFLLHRLVLCLIQLRFGFLDALLDLGLLALELVDLLGLCHRGHDHQTEQGYEECEGLFHFLFSCVIVPVPVIVPVIVPVPVIVIVPVIVPVI